MRNCHSCLRDSMSRADVSLTILQCWINRCVKGKEPHSKYMYDEQIYFNKFLAFTAHKYGMAAGLKVRTRTDSFKAVGSVHQTIQVRRDFS